MKFGPVPLARAQGAILAHAVQLDSGKLPKGRVLNAEDIARLQAMQIHTVVVAQLDPDDLDENEAARRIGAALVPDPAAQRLRLTVAATGRVNLYATSAGVVEIDAAAVQALNRINPMITLATVPRYARTEAGHMVGTVKIIAYGVPGADVARACDKASYAMRIAPPVFTTASLIETRIGPDMPAPKGRQVMARRLQRLGLGLTDRTVVSHDEAAIAQAIQAAPGQVIFVLTASATSDPADVAPAAVRAAGGQVVQFGIPVDPGNLLFLGQLGGKPVIGLPGCARSPALNGADWVLERVICGVPVGPDDLASMGIGGLLKESPARGRLRDQ